MRFSTLFLIACMLLMLISASSVFGAAYDLQRECKKSCLDEKRAKESICKDTYKQCIGVEKQISDSCLSFHKSTLADCKAQCLDSGCNFACMKSYRNSTKECKYSTKFCIFERKACLQSVAEDTKTCVTSCKYLNSNITCNGIAIGARFAQDCDVCTCRFDGSVTCKKSPLCHFDDTNIGKQECESALGLSMPLCVGPYFDILCSQDTYCLCSGVSGYQCPSDSYCVTDFTHYMQRNMHLPGWSDYLGNDLGAIGICAKNPELPSCGDGICDNLICQDCYTETSFNCPQDCSE